MSDAAAACPSCGHPAPAPQAYVHRRTEGLAVASFVLGLAGLFVCPIVCSIIAVVLAHQARHRLRADPELEGVGLAKAGLILGWVGVGFGILVVAGIVALYMGGAHVRVPTDGIDALWRIR
jgi:hypothetical protein